MVMTIFLGRGYAAWVDWADYSKVAKHRWHAEEGRTTVYARTKIKGKLVRMHRLIMGAAADQEVDHLNGDGLDNRRVNMRLTDHSGNLLNRVSPTRAASGFRGVYRHGKRWRVELSHEGEKVIVGYFDTPEEGADAYAAAFRKYRPELPPPLSPPLRRVTRQAVRAGRAE